MVAFETWWRAFEFTRAADAENEHQQAAERHDVCELPRERVEPLPTPEQRDGETGESMWCVSERARTLGVTVGSTPVSTYRERSDLWERSEEGVDHHWHAGHALEGAERA